MGKRLSFDECWSLNTATGCHEWRRGKDGRGYGAFYPEPNKQVRAHRYAYERAKGTIPPGLDICHRCDNTACVNPEHLFPGTHTDNMRDMASKVRGNIGVNSSAAKLTEADVIKIRAMRAAGMPMKTIAASFPVGRTVVSRIVSRKLWKHVDGP